MARETGEPFRRVLWLWGWDAILLHDHCGLIEARVKTRAPASGFAPAGAAEALDSMLEEDGRWLPRSR